MDIRENLKAYLDGELSPADRATVEAAFAQDVELRQEAAFMKLITKEIESSTRPAQSPGPESVIRNLPKKGGFWRHRWLLGSVAGVLLVAGVIGKFQKNDSLPSYAHADVVTAGQVESSAPMASAERIRMKNTVRDQSPSAVQEESVAKSRVATEERATAPAQTPKTSSAPSVTTSNRDVIRNANLAIKVKSAAKTQGIVTTITQGAGGFVDSSQRGSVAGGLGEANMILRIPEKQFASVLDALRELGDVQSESVSGQDVTGQAVDLVARIKVQRQEEAQLISLLRGTRNMGEIMSIRERLQGVRAEIESMESQQKMLKEQFNYSTITLTLTERTTTSRLDDPKSGWAEDTWKESYNQLTAIGRVVGAGLITLLVFAPVWIPLSAIAWLIWRKVSR